MKSYKHFTVGQYRITTTRDLDGVEINLPLIRFRDGTIINLVNGKRSVRGIDDIIIDPPIFEDNGPKQVIFFRRSYVGIKTLNIGSIPGCQIHVAVHQSNEVSFVCTGTDEDLAKIIRTMKSGTDLIVDGGSSFAFRSNIGQIFDTSLAIQGQLMAPPAVQLIIYVPETLAIKARGAWNELKIGNMSNSVDVESFGIGEVTIGSAASTTLIQSGRGVLKLEYGVGNLFLQNDGLGDILVDSGTFQHLTIGNSSTGNTIVNGGCNVCAITAHGNGGVYVRSCRSTPAIVNLSGALITVNP